MTSDNELIATLRERIATLEVQLDRMRIELEYARTQRQGWENVAEGQTNRLVIGDARLRRLSVAVQALRPEMAHGDYCEAITKRDRPCDCPLRELDAALAATLTISSHVPTEDF